MNIMVVDNASTDNTIEIVNGYASKDQRIKVFKFDKNIGGEGNFTRCIQLADGEYTAIYHSDDVYENTIVEQQVTFLETYKNAGAVFTSAIYIDKEGRQSGVHKIPHELTNSRKIVYDFLHIFKLILKYMNFLMCPSAMVRTDIYKKEICIWDGEHYASSADLDVWLRILEKHSIGIINQPLMKYRISKSSFSYHYLRTRIQRHDVFLVLDHYVATTKELLDATDISNYQFLLLKDDISRVISLLIQNKRSEALHVGIGACKNFRRQQFFSRLDYFKISLIGCIGYLMCFVPVGTIGRRFLYYIRYRE
jgi:glycosyltransferase involved in cell wall biosynthesis